MSWTPSHDQYSTPDMSGFGNPCPDDDDVPQSDDEDDPDYCDDDEVSDDDSELEDGGYQSSQTPVVQTQYFPIRDRGVRHPVASFNDTSAFQEADVSFFGRAQHSDVVLAEKKEFSCKNALKDAIAKYHLSENIEVKCTDSGRSKMIYKCKDTRFTWRLYATSSFFGSRWVIKTLLEPHTSTNRTDHAQLTTRLIANIIKDDIREDVTKALVTSDQ